MGIDQLRLGNQRFIVLNDASADGHFQSMRGFVAFEAKEYVLRSIDLADPGPFADQLYLANAILAPVTEPEPVDGGPRAQPIIPLPVKDHRFIDLAHDLKYN